MIGLLVGAIVAAALLVDEGEVVTLVTRGENGSQLQTQLWIVDDAGTSFLRASSERADWLGRLRAAPEVELRRGDARSRFLATPVGDPAVRRSVNELMDEKYGTSDRLMSLFLDPARAVPVRLEFVADLADEPSATHH